MFKINNTIRSFLTDTKTTLLLATIASWAFMPQSTANEVAEKYYSISQGQFSQKLDDNKRKEIIIANKLTTTPDQLTGKASSKTRSTLIHEQQSNSDNALKSATYSSKIQRNVTQDYLADFAIYSASTFVQDDFDDDGFFQTFSVAFDADIYSYTPNQFGEVYALLYVSKNGGPWTHYFTTDDFVIESDSDLDEYEVITTFLSGYATDHYDVLIDLYQVGYSDIVASFSSDDSNALYALPIESADYDEPYIEIVETHGGSIAWLILCLFSIYFLRTNANTN